MNNLVFIHGWGMNSLVWQPLVSQLSEHKTYTVDLGYIVGGKTDWPDPAAPAIYITHSLGTQWLLHHWAQNGPPDKASALIAINGFSCFKDFTSEAILATMQQGLSKNPAAQMAMFWRRAAGSKQSRFHAPPNDLNVERLAEGLSILADGDERPILQSLTIPHLCLAGITDRIVPPAATGRQWPDDRTTFHQTASHMLPVEDPAWCAVQIRKFLARR